MKAEPVLSYGPVFPVENTGETTTIAPMGMAGLILFFHVWRHKRKECSYYNRKESLGS